MKLVFGFFSAFAAEQRAIVGEFLEMTSVKKKSAMGFFKGAPDAVAPLLLSTNCTLLKPGNETGSTKS